MEKFGNPCITQMRTQPVIAQINAQQFAFGFCIENICACAVAFVMTFKTYFDKYKQFDQLYATQGALELKE